jgi:hypothetical protein
MKNREILLARIQSIKENTFTQTVLVPLFKSFGYAQVEFHGGTAEEGKDLICWRRDELGEVELAVAQVKRYRPSRKAKDQRSFSEIVTQICQCLELPVPYSDGKTYLPSSVYFITPYPLDTLTLESRFSKVAALKQARLKIIDGPKLATLVSDRIPTVASDLLGSAHRISQSLAPHLSNQILMSALGFPATRHIKDFYTDIDIAVGQVDAKYFFSSCFAPTAGNFELDEIQWTEFKQVFSLTESEFGISVLKYPVAEIDLQFSTLKSRWKRWKNENRQKTAISQKLAMDVKDLRQSILSKGETKRGESVKGSIASATALNAEDILYLPALALRLKSHSDPVCAFLWERLSPKTRDHLISYMGPETKSDVLLDSLLNDLNEIILGDSIFEEGRFRGVELPRDLVTAASSPTIGEASKRLNRLLISAAFPLQIAGERHELVKRIEATLKSIEEPVSQGKSKAELLGEPDIARMLLQYRKLHDEYTRAGAEAIAHHGKEPKVKVIVYADGSALAAKLEDSRRRIREETKHLNKHKPDAGTLRRFIENCKRVMFAAASILRDGIIREIVGFSPTDDKTEDWTRLHFPVDLVFATGLNVAVLGEAGAGKTTALQMHAHRKMEETQSGTLAIFAPLARVVRSLENSLPDVGKEGVRPLDFGIVKFLESLGAKYTVQDFKSDALHGGVIILDSIDEAYVYAPWVIESLVAFGEQYPNLQIITSSRVSGEYAERIPFVGIRLMPFTDQQQLSFVSSWFGDDPEGHIETIQKHLIKHRDVADSVRNPLLATAMCALQEHRVPLPTSEIRLYQEWLSLLIGIYDIHKDVSRIRSPRHHLELLAKKIAFHLHVRGLREDTRNNLTALATELFDDIMTPIQATAVLDELVHPCNILVPIAWGDNFGFTHLRYQEYLAAREIRDNRGIKVSRFLGNSWWKGVLILFAQMHESLEWLVDEVADLSIDPITAETMIAMIDSGPRKGARELREFAIEKARLDSQIREDLAMTRERSES